jgi:hypothetical protein
MERANKTNLGDEFRNLKEERNPSEQLKRDRVAYAELTQSPDLSSRGGKHRIVRRHLQRTVSRHNKIK